jgi:hypothetical protein
MAVSRSPGRPYECLPWRNLTLKSSTTAAEFDPELTIQSNYCKGQELAYPTPDAATY